MIGGKMTKKWTKKLKDEYGYTQAKELYIPCGNMKKKCFRVHDWNHDGHLVCITNANHGCPKDEIL
jgi:hypothetical protein